MMTGRIRLFTLGVCAVMMALCHGIADAAAPTFTKEQMTKGRAAYRQHCVECHGGRLEGLHVSPALSGSKFDTTWRGKSLDVFAFHMRRMPQEPVGQPGSLSDEQYTNILAYILQANGFEPGDTALPSDTGKLASLTVPLLPGMKLDPDKPTVAPGESALLNAMTPVTDAMLKDVPDGDWLFAGRSYDGAAHSPLKTINQENVGELSLAWRRPLRNGVNMATPLVHDGVVYLHTFPDTVLAIDGASGDILWRHQYKPQGAAPSQKMGLGLHGDRLYVPTSDIHVLSLNAKTGELVWDHEIEVTTPAMRGGYNLRSAPLPVGDVVVQGVTASFVPKGGFMVAIDRESGEEKWRFNTIARPGEAFGNSWNGVPMEKRSGGSVWHQGTYDPELDLMYFGVAPTYDTGPLVKPKDDESVTSHAMYTNCTVAIRPSTGELVWSYQHMPNDQWDLDWVFERQIATIPVDGEDRKVVWNIGKMGMMDALDAKTGAYLFSIDAGIQNIIIGVDPQTGTKTIDPGTWPDPNRPCDVCPSAFGARAWPQTSYSPSTYMVYAPLTESCMHLSDKGLKLLTSGVGIGPATHPDSADGLIGRLQAFDVMKQELAWVHELAWPLTTATMSTGGGLVFVGDTSPALRAFNDETGEQLWESPLDDLPSGSVVSYAVGDKQHVMVVVGMPNLHVNALTGGLLGVKTEMPGRDKPAPKGGAGIWVFSL